MIQNNVYKNFYMIDQIVMNQKEKIIMIQKII